MGIVVTKKMVWMLVGKGLELLGLIGGIIGIIVMSIPDKKETK